MNAPNTLIRSMIKDAVIAVMILSIPVKVFNIFFEWRQSRQAKLIRKNNYLERS